MSVQDKAKQVERVKKLFWRQLRTPLADHADTLDAYEEWASETGEPKALPSDVQAELKKAVKVVDSRLPYEQSVSCLKKPERPLSSPVFSKTDRNVSDFEV